MANYELWYADDLGNRLAYINDVMSFEYIKVFGDIGIGVFQFPQRNQVYNTNLPDRQIHVYRQPIGGSLSLDFTCRLRKFDTATTLQGQFFRTFRAYDHNELLRRRISAYYAGAAESSFSSDYVDDGMKQIFTDNFIDNADYSGTPSPARDIDAYGFSVAPDLSAGPQLSKAFSWRNVLAILQDLQAESKANGSEVFFGLVGVSETAAQFRTYTGQPGADRTVGNEIIFSLENGNLYNPQLSYDHTQEANYVYAGGQGEEDERIIATASDTDRMNVSRLGRIEKFAGSQGKQTSTVQADADNELERNRPRTTFSASIADTPSARYGRDWNVGDKVKVSYAGLQFNTIIRSVKVSVSASGAEAVASRVENIS